MRERADQGANTLQSIQQEQTARQQSDADRQRIGYQSSVPPLG
jgi:hypothetical protein